MQRDGPTWTNLPRFDHEADTPPEPLGTPTWPEPPAGGRRSFGRDGSPFGSVNTLILGASLFANVVLLIALISVLLLSHSGALASGGSAPQGSVAGAALSTPTATAIATTTPLNGGELQISPSSVQLSCDGGQRSQVVVLANNGPETVQWQASFSGSGFQAPITINPNRGELQAGASVSIQIQINRRASGSQQGTITFVSGTSDAGAGPSLSYTTNGCNN